MWPKFGFFDQAFIDSMKTWTTDWPKEAEAWQGENGATVAAFEFGSMPEEMAGQADAVLLIRALHNLARFESDGGYSDDGARRYVQRPAAGRHRRRRAA